MAIIKAGPDYGADLHCTVVAVAVTVATAMQ